jgi:hypothetical protein
MHGGKATMGAAAHRSTKKFAKVNILLTFAAAGIQGA